VAVGGGSVKDANAKKPEVMGAANWQLLSARGQAALARLVQHDEVTQAQAHVYGDWPAAGTDDTGKQQLAEQVRSCNLSAFFRSEKG
jgi:hypothetical protein